MQSPDDESNQILATVKYQFHELYHFHEKAGISDEGLNTATEPDEIEIILVKLLGYKTQVVNGTNYFLEIVVGDKVIHVKVFQPISGESAQLHSIDENNLSLESELAYFESLS